MFLEEHPLVILGEQLPQYSVFTNSIVCCDLSRDLRKDYVVSGLRAEFVQQSFLACEYYNRHS